MPKFLPPRANFLPSLAIAAICLLVFLGPRLGGNLLVNYGYVLLNRELVTADRGGEILSSGHVFREITQNDSVGADAWRGLGYTFALQLKRQEALRSLNHVPFPGLYSLLIGDWFWEENYWDEATYWYETAVSLEPGLVNGWIKVGDAYLQLDNPEKALSAYQTAWQQDHETSAEKYVSQLIEQGKTELAETTLKQTLASANNASRRLWLWHTLGQLLREQQRWAEAIEHYQAAIAEFPNTPSFLISIGWSFYDSGSGLEAAYPYFEQAVTLEDSLSAEGKGTAYFAMGRLLAREGNYQAADPWFQRALEKDETNLPWYIARANTAVLAQNHPLAVSVLENAVAQYPKFSQGYLELSRVYLLTGDTNKAVTTIDKALEYLSTPQLSYYIQAGEIYQASGNLEKAIKAYQMALEIDADNQQALHALEQLSTP